MSDENPDKKEYVVTPQQNIISTIIYLRDVRGIYPVPKPFLAGVCAVASNVDVGLVHRVINNMVRQGQIIMDHSNDLLSLIETKSA